MIDPSRIRSDLASIGVVSDGASERCEFIEVSAADGRFLTLDLTSATGLTEENYQNLLSIITSQLG